MAERSKAPDSRFVHLPMMKWGGLSGLRMEAWVRIPVLTTCRFAKPYFNLHLDRKSVFYFRLLTFLNEIGCLLLEIIVSSNGVWGSSQNGL